MTSALTIATISTKVNYWAWCASSIFLLKSVRIRASGKDKQLRVGSSLPQEYRAHPASSGPSRHRLQKQRYSAHTWLLMRPSSECSWLLLSQQSHLQQVWSIDQPKLLLNSHFVVSTSVLGLWHSDNSCPGEIFSLCLKPASNLTVTVKLRAKSVLLNKSGSVAHAPILVLAYYWERECLAVVEM